MGVNLRPMKADRPHDKDRYLYSQHKGVNLCPMKEETSHYKQKIGTSDYTPTLKHFCVLSIKIVIVSSGQDVPCVFHQQRGFAISYSKANVENEMCSPNFFQHEVR